MNFGPGKFIMANTPGMLTAQAAHVEELGRPELEVFDTGRLAQVHDLIKEG